MNKKQQLTNEEVEFLQQSNFIEREYGEEALEDAKIAWEYAKRKSKDKWTIPWLLKIHKRLLQRLAPHYAGKIRTGAVMIGGEVRSQSKEQIIIELLELFGDYRQIKFLDKDIESKEEYIKNWHIKYEGIHPFSDGNGRTGRILMNLQRVELGLPILIIHEGLEQQKYYQWFKGGTS